MISTHRAIHYVDIRPRMQPGPEILNYAATPSRRQRLLDRATVPLSGVFFIVTVLCVYGVMGHLEETHWTPQFSAYINAQALQRSLHPGYVAPPFVGQRKFPDSLWLYPVTYGALLFPAAAITLFIYGVRPRQPGSAG